MLKSHADQASVTVDIKGAQEIYFTYLSPFTPFMSYQKQDQTHYLIANDRQSAALNGYEIDDAKIRPMLYSPLEQKVYAIDFSNQWRSMIYHESNEHYTFIPDYRPGSLIQLFCNLYISYDGSTYEWLEYQTDSIYLVSQEGKPSSFSFQTCSADIPDGVVSIRLELSGYGQVPNEYGDRYDFVSAANIGLTDIKINGEFYNSPTDIPDQPQDSSKSDSLPEDESQINSSSAPNAIGSIKPNSSNSSKNPDSSKRPNQNSSTNPSSNETVILPSQIPQTGNGTDSTSELSLSSGKEKKANHIGRLYLIGAIGVIACLIGYSLYRAKHNPPEPK